MIADGDGESAARAALSRDGHNNRNGQARHLAQVSRDGLGLAAFFRVDSRIRARRVNECEDGPAEFRGELHDAQRLPVALGLGLAEILGDALLGVSALLLADEHNGASSIFCEAGHHRGVIAVGAVTVQLMEIFKQDAHVIHHVGTLRMARH